MSLSIELRDGRSWVVGADGWAEDLVLLSSTLRGCVKFGVARRFRRRKSGSCDRRLVRWGLKFVIG